MTLPADLPTGRVKWSGINYYEPAPDSPKESRTRDHGRVTRTLAVQWNLRHAFRAKVLGYAEITAGGTSSARVTRWEPMQYAPSLEWGTLYAVAIDNMKPVGKPIGISSDGYGYPNYEGYCQMDVHFEHVNWQMNNDDTVMEDGVNVAEMRRYLKVEEHPHGEFLTVDGGYFQWAAETDPTKKRTSIRISKSDYTSAFTMTRVSVPGKGYPLQEFIGKVNSKTMIFEDHVRSYTFNPQTLLLVDADRKPIWMPNGKPAFDYLFYFNYRPNFVGSVEKGHNWVRRFKPGPPPTWQYEQISVDGTTSTADDNMLYNEKDLRLLFTSLSA